jgi:hypothetical protein
LPVSAGTKGCVIDISTYQPASINGNILNPADRSDWKYWCLKPELSGFSVMTLASVEGMGGFIIKAKKKEPHDNGVAII